MKEQLLQLIEAYAAARASGNGVLQQFATSQLSVFLDGIEVSAKSKPEADEVEAGDD
jgi:hypothetical protein